MKRIFLAGVAALALSATAGQAQSLTDQVVAGLQAQGYTRIEVREGPTQIKVEAIQGTTKVEYVYDRATGEILKQEVEAVEPGEDILPGIETGRDDDDFVDRDGDDDEDGDHHGGDDDDDGHHGGDDNDDHDDDDDHDGDHHGGDRDRDGRDSDHD